MNNGEWTDARFRSFVMSGLRTLSIKWPPKYKTRKAAWKERGKYKCAGYNCRSHVVAASVHINGQRRNNVYVDHIRPVIEPAKGFVSWDEVVKRMFVETDGLQVLCLSCHKNKTADERLLRKKK